MTSLDTARTGGPQKASRWRRVLLIGLVLPMLAAVVLVWATTGRPDNLDRVPVAIVNNDQIIQKPQPMAAGRALAAALTNPSSNQTNLDWTLANTDDAAAGLNNGDYYAVLTIPKDFSKTILSTGTDSPTQGKLQLVSNAAASTTVPFISQAVATAAATSLGRQSTQGYLGQVYDGFNTLASDNKKAASNADKLTSGTDQVAQGAADLDSGTDQLATGLGELATGAGELADGTESLRQGADSLAGGAGNLARGARRLSNGAGDLAANAGRFAAKERSFARGARKVATGSTKVSVAAKGLSLGARQVDRDVAAHARVCERAGGSRVFCNALARASRRTGFLAEGALVVSDLTRDVARANDRLAAGATELAAGSRRLAAGAKSLDAAGRRVSSGAGQLDSGATSLARGVTETDRAADQLATGSASSAAAGNKVAAGSRSLSSGAASADSGAHQLSDGLAKLADGSPTYSKKQQQTLTTVVSDPVVLTSTVEHDDHGNGWLLALVLAVVLWLAALLGVLRRDPNAALRQAGTPISSRRLTMVQLRPATGLALLQGAAVLVALLLLQVGVASPVALGVLTLLAATTFTLVGVAMRWAFGGLGIIGFVLFLLLQAAALGNVLPVETAPEPLPILNRMMPLTAYVNGASQLASGGSVGSLAGVVVVLLVWGAASTFVALMVVRRRRVSRTSAALSVPATAVGHL
jgi:putative membrane protein